MKTRTKFILGAILGLSLIGVGLIVWGLSSRDYRVYWTAADGTVIAGVTSAGRLDTLAGANIGGPLSIAGAFSFTGDLALGTKFTVASATGNTMIAGTLTVKDVLTFSDGGTIDNTAADTLTVTETKIALVGATDVTGNFGADGTLVLLDGSTSVRGISAGFTSLESPANRLGVSATIYMSIATTAVTGATAITHTGTAPAVTWAADSLTFTGAFEVVGATILDALSLSDVLTFSDGGTIDNTAADTLTITETKIGLTGNTTVTGTASFTSTITHATATNSGAVMVSKNTVAYTNTTAKDLFVLPANAYIVDVVTVVTTTFDSDGTDLINVGTTGTPDLWVDDLSGAAAGVLRLGSGATMPYAGMGSVGAEAVTVKGIYAAGGSAPTQGEMLVLIYWVLSP